MEEQDITKINCFAIMPFADDFSPVFGHIQKVIDELNDRNKDLSLTLERSDSKTKEPFIYQNISRHIDDCDIAFIDITGQNHNVVFEFGYAFAQGKRIIPFTQDDTKTLSADYRSFIYIQYDTNELTTFESSLRLRLQEVIDSIKQSRIAELLKKRVTIQKDEFEVSCFTNRKVANLQKHFENAKDQIRIVQTNLSTVLQQYADLISQALKSNPLLEVRMLTLDPESHFAAVRASQLGVDVSEFRYELHRSLFELYQRFKEAENFEIRIYDDFPTQICFIIDREIYNCVVSKYQPSRNNCVFKLDANYPALHTSFNLHFTSVWRDSRTTKKYDPSKIRFNFLD